MPSVRSDARLTGPARRVVPVPGGHVAVPGDDVAHRRERHRQRVRRDLADAVVGRVRHPDAVPRAGRGVDGVVAGPDAAHDAQLGERGDPATGFYAGLCRLQFAD